MAATLPAPYVSALDLCSEIITFFRGEQEFFTNQQATVYACNSENMRD
jgi:hypothetical protein